MHLSIRSHHITSHHFLPDPLRSLTLSLLYILLFKKLVLWSFYICFQLTVQEGWVCCALIDIHVMSLYSLLANLLPSLRIKHITLHEIKLNSLQFDVLGEVKKKADQCTVNYHLLIFLSNTSSNLHPTVLERIYLSISLKNAITTHYSTVHDTNWTQRSMPNSYDTEVRPIYDVCRVNWLVNHNHFF